MAVMKLMDLLSFVIIHKHWMNKEKWFRLKLVSERFALDELSWALKFTVRKIS